MQTYAQILMVASPIFFLMVMAEKCYGWWVKKDDFKAMDMISSLSSGFTNALKDSLQIGVSILTYQWLVSHVALIHIPFTWINVIIAFVALDFSGYWGHRINHVNNFFWNQHIIHHSSEEFNLACALRQSISNLVNFFTVFLLPAALLGVDDKIILIVAPLHLFAQFWYHTVYIGKLGFLEKIIVTPSHHRVHHAINPIYIDKNHGQIFIIWDKLFGTFQEELDSEPPVYGITVPARTWNPIKINYQHIWLMLKDTYRASNWADRLKIWYGPTGYRPADVAAKYPLTKIENPYNYNKYYPTLNQPQQLWAWLQFAVAFVFLMHLYSCVGQISYNLILVYALFLYMMVYSYTEFMDNSPYAIVYEILKNILGISIIMFTGTWFQISSDSWASWLILSYLLASTAIVYLLTKTKLNLLKA
jgi:alkylglycerol monooxygenase